ncbi:MAG: GNAT family N-acetyltransferase [Vicingaceae bacterium]
MDLTIREVKTKTDRKDFVDLQFLLYKGKKHWVPPMKKDELKALDPASNPAFKFCDTKAWLVERKGEVVGRVVAIVHNPYNKKKSINYGRINRIEFVDDKDVFDLLIDTCESWFKEKGMDHVHGPLGFSNLDTQGLLIDGFDFLPSIASVYHLPYYKDHFERRGFEKENDWVEFRLTLTEGPVNKANRGVAIIKRRFGFESHRVQTKEELKKFAPRIFEILNKAFAELPYVAELNQEMIDSFTKKYFDVIDPRFISLVKKNGELVGFFIGLPSLSEAMQKSGGSLFPFGFIHLMRALKSPKVIDMMLTGVLPEHQANGVAVILIGELQQRMLELGINVMETTGVFETNQAVIANWKNYEHIQHKRRRCYLKKIA